MIVSAPKIIESGFYIIDIPPVVEGLDRTQGGSEGTGGGEHLAPRIVSIVSIFYRLIAAGVNDPDNITL